jgi:HEAT repeat protein
MGSRALAVGLLLAASPAGVRADPATERAEWALRADPSLKVRAQAALLLGQLGGVDSVPALTEALGRDRAAAVCLSSASALSRTGDPLAREALEAAQRSDPDPGVRSAATRALADLEARPVRRRSLVLEEARGRGGDAAHGALRASLARHLAQRGFSLAVAGEEAAYHVKPSLLSLERTESGGQLLIAVTASALAVDQDGRMAAMTEAGARLRTAGSGLTGAAEEALVERALDAAARSLSEDLAARLR